MKSKFHSIFIAALALSGSSAFAQDGFVPVSVIPPHQKVIEGRAVDIVGLKVGMTVEEAEAALLQSYSSDQIEKQQGQYNIGSQGVTVTTAPFVKQFAIGNVLDPNGVEIYFTGPASGNQVILVERSTSFKEGEQPLMATIVDALIAKYGPPSYNMDEGQTVALSWVYQEGIQIECKSVYQRGDLENCPIVMGPYSFDLAKDDDSDAHIELVINAKVRINQYDKTLASWMQVSTVDPNLEHRAGQADFNSLVAQWEVVQAATPKIAAPSL